MPAPQEIVQGNSIPISSK